MIAWRRFTCLATILVALFAHVFAYGLNTVYTQQSRTLDVYWIDVEGGAATLVITPSGQSILMDTGWGRPDDRDARRVQAAMQDAGIERLDFLITSHFHRDHVGGLSALAERVEVGQFIDHGDSVEQDREPGRDLFDSYLEVVKDRRRSVAPGDRLRVDGVDFSFVASHRAIRERTSSMGPNVLCRGADPGEEDRGENAHSVGYLLSLGGFQFLNLGDLTPDMQHQLACPGSVLGAVDILQIPHHGNGVAPQLVWALTPSVAVMANGPHKGGSPAGYEVVSTSPGLAHIWQLHRSLDTDAARNTSERRIANLTEENDCEGHWIKASVNPDGRSYTVTNARNGASESYAWR